MGKFEEIRCKEVILLSKRLKKIDSVSFVEVEKTEAEDHIEVLKSLFPHTFGQPLLKGIVLESSFSKPLRVGVVFSGGQASGGHNVVTGLFDALKSVHSESVLFGFLNGPSGIINKEYEKLDEERLYPYRNTGGFDLIGSGRTKIQTPEQLLAALSSVQELNLDALVVIGGDDSNTNAAVLAEFFKEHNQKTCVVGVPKTIDGDLKSEYIETSFGFDTACKTYAQIIGNISRDAISAKKYYHFIRLMGRSASHITLECALQTHPNKTILLEEVAKEKCSFSDIVEELLTLILKRYELGKNYGVILVPEGLLEFIPEFKDLIEQLNRLLASGGEECKSIEYLKNNLSSSAFSCLSSIPDTIQTQLLNDRDPHGNVRVSQIDTEQLLMQAVEKKLKEMGHEAFSGVSHFLGYEGRAAWPSAFDAHYCYGLGHVAIAIAIQGCSGYMACLRHLSDSVEEWRPYALPITMMMNIEMREGKEKPVIKKALVDLEGAPFNLFRESRDSWAYDDHYRFPLPSQYFGSKEITHVITKTLEENLKEVLQH